MKLSKKEARIFLLKYQGLMHPRKIKGKQGIINFIKKVGCIQFDPLNIVGRNPDLVLQSRVNNYDIESLNGLLYTDRKLLDGWDKNISIYAIEDWQYFLRYRENAKKWHERKNSEVFKIIPEIRKKIENEGALSSIEIEYKNIVNWFWAPTSLARAALEVMYAYGELIVHHKSGTRKYYDLSHKYIPPDIFSKKNADMTDEQFYKWIVKRRIGSIGLLWSKAGDAWVGIHGLKSNERNMAISGLLKENELIELEIENFKDKFYIRSQDRQLLDLKTEKNKKHTSIIAPLDNILWDRKLLSALFDFDYRWEVYKPVAERKYGYYVLPILYGDDFIARFDPKRDIANSTLIIQNFWWEDGIIIEEALKESIKECFKEFLKYLNLKNIKIEKKLKLQKKISWLENL